MRLSLLMFYLGYKSDKLIMPPPEVESEILVLQYKILNHQFAKPISFPVNLILLVITWVN